MGGFVFVFIITGTEHMRVTIFPKPKKIKGGGDPMKAFSLLCVFYGISCSGIKCTGLDVLI